MRIVPTLHVMWTTFEPKGCRRIAESLTVLVPAILLLMMTGCGRIYLPAGYDMTPLPTAPLTVTSPTQNVSIGLHHSGGYNADESNSLLDLSFSTSGGNSWLGGQARGFLYGGVYDVVDPSNSLGLELDGNRPFYGVGFMGDGNVGIPLPDARIGVGGWVGALGEFGPYSRTYYDSGESRFRILAGGYGLMSLDLTDGAQAGLKVGAGIPGSFFATGSYYSPGRLGVSLGFGITEQQTPNGSRTTIGRISVGLSYTLNETSGTEKR